MASNSDELLHVDAAKNRYALSPVERAAVGMLRADGWSVGELAMTFQVGESAICRSINPQLTEDLNDLVLQREVFQR